MLSESEHFVDPGSGKPTFTGSAPFFFQYQPCVPSNGAVREPFAPEAVPVSCSRKRRVRSSTPWADATGVMSATTSKVKKQAPNAQGKALVVWASFVECC
jgi:hypothetical protein